MHLCVGYAWIPQTSGKTYLTTELALIFYEQQPQGKLGENTGRPITVTFVAQIQFKPDISTAVPDSKTFYVSKYKELQDDFEYINLKPKIQSK